MRAVQQDVRSHQHRVGIQAGGRIVAALLCRLVLELRHAARFTVAGDAHQNPCQLRVLRHVGLDIKGGALRVDAQRQQLCHARKGALAQVLRVVAGHGDGVLVGDEIKSLVIFLQLNELLDGTQVVAQVVGIAGRLQAGDDALFLRRLVHSR